MKLSVIVPIYRAEQTIDRCVMSILGQAFADFEVILVDDGSPDKCPQLCDAWAKRDGRVRVIHQENGGLCRARNAGVDVAEGELITFVDSDDFVGHETYMEVVPLLADFDVVEYPFCRHYGAPWQTKVMFGSKAYDSMRAYWLEEHVYEHSYVWNKVFRRHLFDDVRFPEGEVFEDVSTLPRLLEKARRVATTDKGMYYYCSNPQGITATASGADLQRLLNAHLRVMAKWADDRYYMHVLNIQMDVCEQTSASPLLPMRRVSVLSSGLNKKQRMKALLLRVLGMNALCWMSRILHRWKKPSRR
ncbi:MAG: glycosyltransferase [Prevotella sp.]|nr:glycosyltransferase [Prevotella sp.]